MSIGDYPPETGKMGGSKDFKFPISLETAMSIMFPKESERRETRKRTIWKRTARRISTFFEKLSR